MGKNKILNQDFYNRNTLKVAKDLLGCYLYKKTDGKTFGGMIIETEAYTADDPACHAYRGKTPRSITLFKKPGLAYVYFTYGMHHCMNVVTESEETAGAVLIRALDPIEPISNTHGPARLCKQLGITKEHNEIDLTDPDSPMWLESGEKIKESNIVTTTRIGIKQAADYPWRFYVKNNKFVSKK